MTDERPPRPDAVTVDPDGIPEEPRSRDLWLVWRYEWQDDREEWAKIPKDGKGGGYRIDATDPDNGVAFDTAVETYQTGDCDGLGIITDPDDMLVGWDWDDVRDPDQPHDSIPNLVTEMIDTLDSYIEVSPSEGGYRGFAFGAKPDGPNRADLPCEPILDDPPHVEVYNGSGGRYLTVTGQHVQGTPETVETRPQEIKAIYEEYIAADEQPKPTGNGGIAATQNDATPRVDAPETGPRDAATDLSDDELLDRAMNAENGDKFRQLWNGDTSGYPSHSEARQALANLLAFWTGGDEKRMLRLFRESDLYRDEDDCRTFENYEIPTALRGRTEYYDPAAGRDRPPEPGATVENRDGITVSLTPAEVVAWAGRDGVEDVADLTDREKAACVWDLVKQHDDYHVRVRRDDSSLWAYDAGVWTRDGERILRHAARQALGSMSYGANVLTELKAQAWSDPTVEVAADKFGLSPGMLAVENGLVDLNTAVDSAGDDALRDLRPEDYALARLPVEYDPDATAAEWKQFVGDIVEPAKIEAVQEYVGYTLHRGAMPFNKALLCVGSGANGKSTFLNVVRELLGEGHTTSKPVHKFDEDNHVADLYSTLANIHADLSEGSLSSKGISTFKGLTGSDSIDARRLYEEAFSFTPTAKHLYACNQVPDVSTYVSDHDIAFWRRWIIVEFPNWFPQGSDKRDEDLEDRLTTNETLSGVLNWAIEGRARLLNQGGFTNVEDHDQTRRLWQSWGESVEQFIAECVERDEDAPRLSTGDAYARYQAWCRVNDGDPVGRRRFTDTLKQEDVEYGRHRIDGKVQRGYKALRLSDDVPDPDAGTDDDTDDGSQTSLGDV